MHRSGAAREDIVAYLVAWVLVCTLPGVLVWRAVVGPTTLPRELGFGSVLGIALQLVVWALGIALGVPALQWIAAAGVVLAFVAIPSLRRCWRPARDPLDRTPLRWHLAMALVVVLALLRQGRLVHSYAAIPPGRSILSGDVFYNS